MNLSQIELDRIAHRVKTDIDAWAVRTYSQEHREHLGASLIGHECARHIWYAFRWAKFEVFAGRMLRLFETGHREESRFIQMLRGIGFTIYEVDPNTGKQFRIWGAKGHYGGSTDSVGIAPYPEFNQPILLEFKTHNRGSFANLIKDRLVVSKPRHYAQMCSYGVAYKFEFGLYCAKNKDDEDLYFEIVKLDPRHADDMTRKAEDIIYSELPPPKISLQPSFFQCKFCAFNGICHHNEPMEKNCRSCRNARPIDGAKWHCSHFNQTIPLDFIPKGCDNWHAIG